MPDTCPTCGQSTVKRSPHRKGKRICSLCDLKIGRYHKWEFGEDDRPRHKDCKQPTGIPTLETMHLPL
jgi:hypothetical protein